MLIYMAIKNLFKKILFIVNEKTIIIIIINAKCNN
jgi:hypothetical protein